MHYKIIEAIENSVLIEFEYNGHNRIVECHTYGTFKNGNETLVGYQVDGTSDRGNVPDWKQFTVSKITDLIILDEVFVGTRNGYVRGDSRMTFIHAEL